MQMLCMSAVIHLGGFCLNSEMTESDFVNVLSKI